MRKLTYDDGVNLPFNLQGAVIAAEDVSHLFQLCLLDQQIVLLLKVLLQWQHKKDCDKWSAEWRQSSTQDNSHTTLHFFPSSSSRGGLFWATGWGVFTLVGVFVLIGVACERRLGFLWVFWSSDTCFRPSNENKMPKVSRNITLRESSLLHSHCFLLLVLH